KSHKTHGMSRHPAYAVWRSMHSRCRLSTHQAWHNYGARGSAGCPEWTTFDQFWADMVPTYQPGLTLDRIDNNAGYSLTNCKWRTVGEQANNTRRTVLIDTPLGRLPLTEAARLSGMKPSTLAYRVDHGCPASSIFSMPDPTTALSLRG